VYYSGDQIEKNELVGEYGTYGGKGEVRADLRCGNLKETNHLEDLSLYGM